MFLLSNLQLTNEKKLSVIFVRVWREKINMHQKIFFVAIFFVVLLSCNFLIVITETYPRELEYLFGDPELDFRSNQETKQHLSRYLFIHLFIYLFYNTSLVVSSASKSFACLKKVVFKFKQLYCSPFFDNFFRGKCFYHRKNYAKYFNRSVGSSRQIPFVKKIYYLLIK